MQVLEHILLFSLYSQRVWMNEAHSAAFLESLCVSCLVLAHSSDQ